MGEVWPIMNRGGLLGVTWMEAVRIGVLYSLDVLVPYPRVFTDPARRLG